MADYARDDDAARIIGDHAASIRSLRIQRPKRAVIRTITFEKEGPITLDRYFGPKLIIIDPLETGQAVEYKRVIGVDGWLASGEVELYWTYGAGVFLESHIISAPTSHRVYLDNPFVIEKGFFDGEFMGPQLVNEPPFPSFHLYAYLLIECTPI